jgi:hypothetical protein
MFYLVQGTSGGVRCSPAGLRPGDGIMYELVADGGGGVVAYSLDWDGNPVWMLLCVMLV